MYARNLLRCKCVGKCRNVWDGNLYFKNGSDKQGRGVVILSKSGRYKMERDIFNDKIIIFNIYTPNEGREKGEFF